MRGTTRSLTNSSQSQTDTFRFDAFALNTGRIGTTATAFGFAGGAGYQSDSSGLMLLGHRCYDASTGRFLSRDPIQDGYNWYTYCNNDPVNKIDATGLYAPALVWAGGTLATITVPAWVPVAIVVTITVGVVAWIGWSIWNNQGDITGKPGSEVAFDDPRQPGEGKIRTYGPDGYPIKDIDFGHDHGSGDPPGHDWSRPFKNPARPDKNRGKHRPLLPGE